MAREAARSTDSAAAAADAAVTMARESARSRMNPPQVAIDIDPNVDGPFVIQHLVARPPMVMASIGRRGRLESGSVAMVEWYDCVDARASVHENIGMYTTIAVLDHAGAVFQWAPIEAGAHPLESVPGSNVLVRPAQDAAFGASVHPYLTWDPHEGEPRPELPWKK